MNYLWAKLTEKRPKLIEKQSALIDVCTQLTEKRPKLSEKRARLTDACV